MIKKVLFVAGGVLLGWGVYCWYQQEQKNKKPSAGATPGTTPGTTAGAATSTADLPSPAHQAPSLEVQENRPAAELTITQEPLAQPTMDQAVQYYNTNPDVLYYRPRTTIALSPELAQDVITIDSANMYAR